MVYSIKDVVDNGLCTGCGICTSITQNAEMKWNEYGFLIPSIDDALSTNALKLCPFNPAPDQEVKDENALADLFLSESQNHNKQIGRYQGAFVGYSNEFRLTSASGGIATYLFSKLLELNIVDHLFIVSEDNGSYAYQWFNNYKDIKKTSKTRYIPVTLEKLFKEIDAKPGKVAVSGVACFIKAIRLKQHYQPEYKSKIPFLVGIICGGLKSSFFTDYLAQKAGIEKQYKKQDYRIKDENSLASDYSFGAYDQNDEFKQVKMKSVGDMWGTGLFKSNACDFCTDVTTELADISLGDAWMHPYDKDGLGNSIVITRTILAQNLIQEGMASNELTLDYLSLEKLLLSQKGSFNHRHTGLNTRIKAKKKQNKLLPAMRSIPQKAPYDFAVVQKQRMLVRAKSLQIWKETKNAAEFDNTIKPYLKQLTVYTQRYHRRIRFQTRINGIFRRVNNVIKNVLPKK